MLAALAVTLALGLADERPRAVVLDLAGTEEQLTVRRALSSKIAARLAADGRVDVISGDDLRGMFALDAERQSAGCDESCLAEVAGALDARFLVAGTLGQVGSVYVASLTLFDATRMRSLARTTLESERVEDLLRNVDDEAAKLARALPLPAAARSSGPGALPVALVAGGAIAAVGGVAALVGGGLLFGAQAERRADLDDATNDYRPGDEDDLVDSNQAYAKARTDYANIGVPLLVVGGAVAAIGVALVGTGGLMWSGE